MTTESHPSASSSTRAWPRPLSAEERDRIEERTWNSARVIVYPNGSGRGMLLTTYARQQARPTRRR
jgi:hypothetical protein